MALSKPKKVIIIIISVILALLIITGSVFFVLYKTGQSKFHKKDSNIKVSSDMDDISVEDEDTVIYKEKPYTLNKDIVTVLFLGIKKDNLNKDLGYGRNGEADTIFVAAVNTKNKKIKIIPIQRETMTDINLYSSSGSFSGTKKAQICLAYDYGKTPEKSSENVLTAVSRYLMGINVSSYVTVNLEGVEKLTDLVGGVRVNSLEDIDIPSIGTIKKGQPILLKGKTTQGYLRLRQKTVDGSLLRLERQKQFLSALASTAGNQIKGDFKKLGTFYNALTPYTSTDMTFSQITYLVSSSLSTNVGNSFEYVHIKGERVVGKEWVEFYADNDSLVSAIIDTFYVKK